MAVASVLVAVACSRPRAQTLPEPPPLAAPQPPARVIPAPPPDPPTETAPPTADVPAAPVSRPRPARPRVDTSKPETKKPETPPVAESAAAPPQPAVLQAAPAATQTEMERRTRDQLAQAATDLGRVRLNTLDRDAREQFDTAHRFLQRARLALAERNFVYAQTLADKAATIAADLARRRP